MLGTCATVEMLNSCGLGTMKQQLTLRKLIAGSQAGTSVDTNAATSSQNDNPARQTRNSKLTLQAMKNMKQVDKQVYLIKLVMQVVVLLPSFYSGVCFSSHLL